MSNCCLKSNSRPRTRRISSSIANWLLVGQPQPFVLKYGIGATTKNSEVYIPLITS